MEFPPPQIYPAQMINRRDSARSGISSHHVQQA
jgi:hypothetical protein